MFGPSPLSPASRGVGDIEDRAERLADYERKFPPVRIDLETSVDEDLWSAYWGAHRRLVEEMRRCEELAALFGRRFPLGSSCCGTGGSILDINLDNSENMTRKMS